MGWGRYHYYILSTYVSIFWQGVPLSPGSAGKLKKNKNKH